MKRTTCIGCGCRFYPEKHILNQRYCSRPACQNARRKTWRKYKLKHDPSYKAYRKVIQNKWKINNPDYWVRYKRSVPEKIRANENTICKAEALRTSLKILLEKDILLNLRKMKVIHCNCKLVLGP